MSDIDSRSIGIIGIKYWGKYNKFNDKDNPNIDDNLYEGMFSPEIFNKGQFKFKAKYSFKELKKPRPYYIQLRYSVVK